MSTTKRPTLFTIGQTAEICGVSARALRFYEKNGLSLTDAVNVFFQQSLNAGGFPFAVTEENAELVKAKALSRLMKELQKGDECAESYSEEEALRLLGVEP